MRTDVVTRVVVPLVPDGPTLALPVIAGGAPPWPCSPWHGTPAARRSEPPTSALPRRLAAQVAFALGMEAARQDREQMALLGDRERIARDLHDDVIQQLFVNGIGFRASAARRRRHRHQRVSDAIDSLDDMIREYPEHHRTTSAHLSGTSASRQALLEPGGTAALTLGFEPSIHFEGAVEAGVPDSVDRHLLASAREVLEHRPARPIARRRPPYGRDRWRRGAADDRG